MCTSTLAPDAIGIRLGVLGSNISARFYPMSSIFKYKEAVENIWSCCCCCGKLNTSQESNSSL